MRRLPRLVPVMLLLGMVAAGSTAAHGDAPSGLAVYDAQSEASPIGVISKVPAETDGGVAFAQSFVELGKAQATAAGATLGPLGDAFIATSFPGYSNPTFVTAQYPPSPVFPAQATGSTSVQNGPVHAITFHTIADGSPSASAVATGGSGGMAGVLSVGGVTSQSNSAVSTDGTVTTTAVSTLSNVDIGPTAAPLFTIASMTSTATVKIPLGGSPAKSVVVELTGTLLGGVPVTITSSGISLAGSLPVPATGVVAVDQALKALSADGVTIQAVPVVSSTQPGGATVSGAALQIGYQAPASLLGSLPTDVGTNETVLLGQVAATATSRTRQQLALPPPPPPAVSTPAAPVASGGSVGPPTSGSFGAPASSAFTAPQAVTPPATGVATPPASVPKVSLFALPPRTRNAAASELLLDYRWFIVAAIASAIALLACRRTRLAD